MEARVNDLMECCQGHLTRLFNVKLSPLDFTNSIHSGKGLAAGDKVQCHARAQLEGGSFFPRYPSNARADLPRSVDSHLGHDTQYRPHTKPGITWPCPVFFTPQQQHLAPRHGTSKPCLAGVNSQSYYVDFYDAPSLRHLDSPSDIVHLSLTPASNSSSSSRCHQAVQTWRRDCAILVGWPLLLAAASDPPRRFPRLHSPFPFALAETLTRHV